MIQNHKWNKRAIERKGYEARDKDNETKGDIDTSVRKEVCERLSKRGEVQSISIHEKKDIY